MSLHFEIIWAYKNLLRNRQRSLIICIGIAAAVACVLLMQGFANYTYKGLSKQFSNSGNGHIQIANENYFNASYPEKYRIDLDIHEKISSKLLNEPLIFNEIQYISLKRKFSGIIATSEKSEIFQGHGVELKLFDKIAQSFKYKINKEFKKLGNYDIILGKKLSERLNVIPGDSVSLLVATDQGRTNLIDFNVAGTVETGSSELDSVYLLADIPIVLKLLNSKEIDQLLLGLKKIENTNSVVTLINNNFSQYNNTMIKNLGLRNWEELSDYYNSVKSLYEKILGTINLILGIISILAVTNSILLVIHERRGEIAMLKAIGMFSSKIILILTFETLILGFIGSLIGIIISYIVSYIVSISGGIPMPPPPGSTEGYSLKFLLSISDSVKASIFFMFCSAFSVLLIAKKVFKLKISSGLISAAILLILPLNAILYHPTSFSADFKTLNTAEDLLTKWDKLRGTNDNNLLIESTFENLNSKNEVTDYVKYKVASNYEFVFAVSISDKPGERLCILSTSNGMWMQKEGMRKGLRISPAQRLIGQASNGDVVSVRWKNDYETIELKDNILYLVPNNNSRGAVYSKIEMLWDENHEFPKQAKFYALSGKLLKTAVFSYETIAGKMNLRETLISDQINSGKTRITFSNITKENFQNNFFNPENLMTSMRKILDKK